MKGGKWSRFLENSQAALVEIREGDGRADNELQSDRNSHAEKWKNNTQGRAVVEKKNEEQM